MKGRRTIGVIVTAALLSFPLVVLAADGEGRKPMTTAANEKTTARPSRDLREGKTFAPSEVEFLQRPLASQLVTVNPNGSPQLTVMWFRYENGAILFTTTTDRIKFRNQQKDARAVLSVVDPGNMYKWVIVHGKLSVDNRDPAAFYSSLAEHYLTGDALDAWRKMTTMDKRTVLRLTPTRIRSMGLVQK